MATNDESTATDKQSSSKPPVTLLRTPARGAPEPSLGERIEPLKKAVEAILKDTKWPSESKNAANELLNTVKSSPNVPSNAANDSQDLIKKYIQILEEVEAQLKDAKSKAGMKRWKLLEGIKSIASNRPSKCTLLFQTCQDDVSKVVISINEFLDKEREKEDLVTSGISPGAQAGLTVPGPGRAPKPLSATQTKPSEQSIASNDSPSGAPPTQNPLLPRPEDETSRGPICQEALTIIRKICRAAEIASGSIPVAGDFVAAAAKVGLTFVETIRIMDKNDDLAMDLASQTDKMSKLLEKITETPNADGQQIADDVNNLQKELQRVHDKVNEWKSLGRFNKGFHARDHGEALKGYQGTIQTAMEEMQLLVGIDTRSIVIELRDGEVKEKRRRLLDRLGDGKYGAQGNSIQDVTCCPGTRVKILRQIDSWIRDSPERVLWLRGMAGRGKSTIASTVVENWKCRASCAIFHFRRGQNTLNTRVVCALARQLAGSLVPEVRKAVLDSVRENEDIADERLEEQFRRLFVTSLAKLRDHPYPILIVVDALDESDNPKDAIDFIRLIDRHSASFPVNVKFLLTSRPEVQLLQVFEQGKWSAQDLDTAPDVSDDLRQFIQQAFQQIRVTNSKVPHNWPSSDSITSLVEMSQGLFQWARTVITYVSNGSPVGRLQGLLRQPSMWSGLDDLYHQILSKAFDSLRLDAEREDLLRRVLGNLLVAPYPISLEVIAGLYGDNKIFDEMNQSDIILFLRDDILADLNSLLFIPTSSSEAIRLMHTSIRDLLVSEHRCKQTSYYIDIIHHHEQVASLCVVTMLRDLKENIYDLSDLSEPASEIQDVVELKVSKALLYCCRSWSIHLTEGVQWPTQDTDATTVKLADFQLFSMEKIMYWLEVMSLSKVTKDAVMIAKSVYQWLELCPKAVLESKSLAKLWNDVQRFIAMFSEPIEFGPLHIYVSALPHCPVETELGRLYRKLAKVRTVHGPQASGWPSNLWARSLNKPVRTVAFSPDGNVVASGSDDYTIRLWDTQTGTVIGEPLTGHSNYIGSVRFSPSGRVLASGSYDNTIRLWDIQTGTVIGEPLTGHSGDINSVCFSPDGKVLASGSIDETIRLWDTQSGTMLGEPLTGHSHSVRSVCFSPDGKVLASGSRDNTVRLWDTQTGKLKCEPLTGHSDWVWSVCFSPNGVLASGSRDSTIRLWDAQTGTVIGESLTGHSMYINSICFSPNGKVLASGSDDQTIRLWDAQTRMMIGEPLTGHSSGVGSVSFSPSGKVLASGSYDSTIRLWDTQTKPVVGESLTSDRDSVESVSFSPDGKVLACGFNDGTIQLWDTQTGTVIGEPLTGHSGSVGSVCFSPNGKVLASGSYDDSTIRLWDAQTGTVIGEPLTGHSSGSVCSVCFSPDGKVLASRSYGSTIHLWDAQTGTALGESLTGHSEFIRSVCFSPDGEVLASGSDDQTIRLWDTQTGTAIGEPLTGHTYWVSSVCFSPDGMVLASGSYDNTIRLWDAQTGAALGEPLTSHTHRVSSVCFSPDGLFLGARYWDGHCATWEIVTRPPYETPHSLPLHWNPAFQDHWVVFSSSRFIWLPPQYWSHAPPDISLSGNTLAVRQDRNISLFDVSQGLEL